MEKKGKASVNRPNPSNGSLHRHGRMKNSVTTRCVDGPTSNFILKQQDEKSLRRSQSFYGCPFQTEKLGEVSSSSTKFKKNATSMMRRPKTHPKLLNRGPAPVLMSNTKMNTPVEALSVNKLLVNVTIEQSSGPMSLLLSKDATLEGVIKATLLLYAKEVHKPLLRNDPTSFGLHYSQFYIECLNTADKIKDLGSRNFFLCSKPKEKESSGLSFQSGETVVIDRS